MTSVPETHRDLLENNQVVILTTKGHDGFPQTTALWFLLDDDEIKLTINTARQKTRNLQRNEACTLFFMDPANPYRTVEIRARAHVEPDPDYTLAAEVGKKYGADLKEMDQSGESRVAVTFDIAKINTFG